MSRIDRIAHEFVERFPKPMQNGILYISLRFSTAGHLCCCGCNQEVITPLSPTDWKLIYDGETASLHPSVGSWQLPCRSHYFISRGKVEWAATWSRDRVAAAQAQDRQAKEQHYAEKRGEPVVAKPEPEKAVPADQEMSTSLWLRLRNLWK